MYLANDPGRPGRVRANLEAAARAARLASCGIAVARDYRAARRWSDDESDATRDLELRHLEMQRVAARAERARVNALGRAGSADAEQYARETREEALALGEELARVRLRFSDEHDLQARWEALHERSARRILALCLANGGLYVKLGQYLAQLDYLVPEPYTRVLSALFEHNARSSSEAVAALIEEELGQSVGALFERFEPEPVASASLAQVHCAVERGSGRRLAVKVQHPLLREASAADIAAVGLAVTLAGWLFPDDFRLGFVMDELAPHLPRELDFENEARNLERCRQFFSPGGGGAALSGRIELPTVVPRLSSGRVLTMSFEEGVRMTDVAALREMGVSTASVTRLLSECFCSQIFEGGFVHCDPHPGNVLVRTRPGAPSQPQLVLLDHGLYRELPRRFTLLYAELWRSVLMGDADGIRNVSHELGVGEYYPLLAAMLTGRPWGDIVAADASSSRLKDKGTREDRAQIRGYAKQYLRHIVRVLERVPPPMLLLFKTNDCLRHAERQLGSGVDSLIVTLRHCFRVLLLHHPPRGGVRSRWRRLKLSLASWLLRVWAESPLGPRVMRLVLRSERAGA